MLLPKNKPLLPPQQTPTNIKNESGQTRVDLAAQVQAPPKNPRTEIKVIRLITGEILMGHMWENRIEYVLERPIELKNIVHNEKNEQGQISSRTELRIDQWMPYTSASRQVKLHYGCVGFIVDPSIELIREYLRSTGQTEALAHLEKQFAAQQKAQGGSAVEEAQTIYDEFENAEAEPDVDSNDGGTDEKEASGAEVNVEETTKV